METSTQEVPKASVSILVFVELALDAGIPKDTNTR